MYQQILQILHDSALIAEPEITELRVYGEERFRVKIRGNVTESLTLQIWINHSPLRTRYSYQLFGEERPILRWDNAPHHPELPENFPHHFHNEQGAMFSSELRQPIGRCAICFAGDRRVPGGSTCPERMLAKRGFVT